MKNQKGFSLIELLIVVVIIGIIAAIAIPNLLAARRSANEGSAISSLRTLHGAEMTYASTTGAGGYGDLVDLGKANLIDTVLGCTTGTGTTTCTKSGYKFGLGKTNSTTGSSAFGAVATPVTLTGVTATGTRDFSIETPGVITFAPITTAQVLTFTAAGAVSGTSTPLNN